MSVPQTTHKPPPDPRVEVKAMRDIAEILAELPEKGRDRVIAWLTDLHRSES